MRCGQEERGADAVICVDFRGSHREAEKVTRSNGWYGSINASLCDIVIELFVSNSNFASCGVLIKCHVVVEAVSKQKFCSLASHSPRNAA